MPNETTRGIQSRWRHPPAAPYAPNGIWRRLRRANSSGDGLNNGPTSWARDAHVSVSTKPGHTQFARIPSAAWANARLLVMLITAALLALYGRLARLPILPAIDARLPMTPLFCAIIVGSTAWLAKKTAFALMFMATSQCSSVTSSVVAAR